MLQEISRPVLHIAPFDHVFSFTLNMVISGQSRENGRTRARIDGGEGIGRGPHRER